MDDIVGKCPHLLDMNIKKLEIKCQVTCRPIFIAALLLVVKKMGTT